MNDALYIKKEGDDSAAMTHLSKRRMNFKRSELTLGACIHELFHAYCAGLHLRSVEGFTMDQFEEVIAEWAEVHIDEWRAKARAMFDKMKDSGVG